MSSIRGEVLIMGCLVAERLGNQASNHCWFDSRQWKMTLCPWARHFTLLALGECPWTCCKSLWIRASAKWLNVNVNVCVVDSYRTFVSEDAGPNTLVATVLAKDPDGDGITYKITAGNEEGNFVIDSHKGTHTRTPYTHEYTPTYKLKIQTHTTCPHTHTQTNMWNVIWNENVWKTSHMRIHG